jgi:asparagine synthase (glutamine-hydrolysing)
MGTIAGFHGSGDFCINNILDKLRHWIPDRENSYTDNEISLGCLELFNTPESYLTPQPFQFKNFVIVADCRIDNREELALHFNIPDVNEVADIEYIALAYEKWGVECTSKLYGDFAFVIWDKDSKKLFGARDHIGIKTLYYTIVNNTIVFSSEIKGVLAYPLFERRLNEKYFIYSFGAVSLPVTETPYLNLYQFPSGSFFEWQDEKLTITKYWELGMHFTIVSGDTDMQVKEFNRLLFQAVGCRLRTQSKIGAEVSGGLDSTGIAAIAMELSGKGAELYPYCYGKAIDAETDATDDVHIVKEFCNKYKISDRLTVLNENDYLFDTFVDTLVNVYDDNDANGVPLVTGCFLPNARKKNIGVMLSGHGGDQLVTSLSAVFDLQKSYKREYVHLWKGLNSRFNIIEASSRFVFYFFKGLDAKRFLRKTIALNQALIKKSGLKLKYVEKYNLSSLPADTFELHSQSNALERYKQCINYPDLQQRAYHHDLLGKHYNLEYRFPLLDVRLLEYVISLPHQTVAPNGKIRHLFTEAVAGYIPKEIIEVKKSAVSTTPFFNVFKNKNYTLIRTYTENIIANTNFSDYFEDDRINELMQNGNMKFLKLALLYAKILRK